MDEEYKTATLKARLNGTSIIVTIPKVLCDILHLKEGSLIEVKIKKVK